MNFSEIKHKLVNELTPVYGDREAVWIVRALMEDVMGWSATDMVLKEDYDFTDYTAHKLLAMGHRIAGGEPVQYVTGKAPFYGMTFKVAPGVLIPRPETAGLIDLIVDRWRDHDDLQVLDCGTGSGCIAIALARNLPFSHVTAIDISADALSIARENAQLLNTRIECERRDMLSLPGDDLNLYDIIVNNPPYIARHEAAGMEHHVLDYEPALALFVPDDDPLKFYRAVAQYAVHALKVGGMLYFEINPLYAGDLKAMLTSVFDDVDIFPDAQGRLRYAQCVMRNA